MSNQDPGAAEAEREAVTEVHQAFAANLSLEEFGQVALRVALRMVGGDSGTIMLLRSGDQVLQIVAAIGPATEHLLGLTQDVSASVAGRAMLSRMPLTIKGLDNGSAYPRDLLWTAVVPLIVGRRVLGVLNVNSDRNSAVAEAFTARLKHLAEHLAPILARY